VSGLSEIQQNGEALPCLPKKLAVKLSGSCFLRGYLVRLQLRDFRNYARLDADFSADCPLAALVAQFVLGTS
jgi:hypothetical protein